MGDMAPSFAPGGSPSHTFSFQWVASDRGCFWHHLDSVAHAEPCAHNVRTALGRASARDRGEQCEKVGIVQDSKVALTGWHPMAAILSRLSRGHRLVVQSTSVVSSVRERTNESSGVS